MRWTDLDIDMQTAIVAAITALIVVHLSSRNGLKLHKSQSELTYSFERLRVLIGQLQKDTEILESLKVEVLNFKKLNQITDARRRLTLITRRVHVYLSEARSAELTAMDKEYQTDHNNEMRPYRSGINKCETDEQRRKLSHDTFQGTRDVIVEFIDDVLAVVHGELGELLRPVRKHKK